MRKASQESNDNQEEPGEQPAASLQPSLQPSLWPSNPATDTESNLGGDRQPARLTASQQVVNAEVTTSSRLRGESVHNAQVLCGQRGKGRRE